MKTLILMRHAKSDWTRAIPDFERPLNARGRRAAALMGAWLADLGQTPDAALVSSALRTRETWARMAPLLASAPQPVFRDDLYLAEPKGVLDAIRGAGAAARLFVLGHNPGMEAAMSMLAESRPRLSAPTAAAAILAFDVKDWSEADFGLGVLQAFETPKGLV